MAEVERALVVRAPANAIDYLRVFLEAAGFDVRVERIEFHED